MIQAIVDVRQAYLVVDSPYQVARWHPLGNWALYIPHAVILYALQTRRSTSTRARTAIARTRRLD
jgi:hypothetical protein